MTIKCTKGEAVTFTEQLCEEGGERHYCPTPSFPFPTTLQLHTSSRSIREPHSDFPFSRGIVSSPLIRSAFMSRLVKNQMLDQICVNSIDATALLNSQELMAS